MTQIIGIICKDSQLTSVVTDKAKEKGFSVYSLNDKIREMSGYLHPRQSKDVISKLRKSGYKIHKHYWINLLIASIPKNNKILFTELEEEDCIPKIMEIHRVDRKNLEDVIKSIV